MTLQLWLIAAVAIVGNLATVANGLLSGRHAMRLALRTRDIDRRDARQREYEEACVQFLSAARVVRSPQDGEAVTPATALSELRRAATRIELYGPKASGTAVLTALERIERLQQLRAGQSRGAEVAEAESRCDGALDAARSVLAVDLGAAR
ncbi:hypothetical protein [Nocardia sp. alder85J]|uniref:hypothetical protein n=1 Tax=Nocardia sp. alder85J TaxID=2862949 RepID=UPI001CD22A6C|nr:hypothetical protein [Nocardia sp. alder85J]MCX4094156.1 hypothetical protein [Nocardia sp. alder85J]